METKLVYNNKAFKIINQYGYKSSNNEVTFNDIKVDFTDCTIADIPYKYQEIKIMEADTEENILNGKVLFTGYLDSIDLSEMKLRKEEREITLTLLSPLKMATKRNVTLIGTNTIREAIVRVLQPLLDDGFIIQEMNVPEGQITTNFVLESVEYCMNNIGFKRNIFWYINERKEIFVNSIDYMFGLATKKTISYKSKEKGLLRIQPTIENIDYANVINFKNVRLIYSSREEEYPNTTIGKIIKKGDIVNFDNLIIIDEATLRTFIEENPNLNRPAYAFNILLQNNSTADTFASDISIPLNEGHPNYNEYIIYSDGRLTFSDDDGEEGDIVLQRDSFFKNLITGFKWNRNETVEIKRLYSDISLRYTTMRFMYSAEINKLKGIISNSGQIEKVVDYNNAWTSLPQLISYARSLMTQNSNVVNQVELEYDIDTGLSIGDIVEIDEPDFYIKGKFAVKDIKYTYQNENDQNWKITLKNTDLISTYIDIFRPKENEESEDTINTVILSEFVEEQINEVHSLELNNSQTLNSNLEV